MFMYFHDMEFDKRVTRIFRVPPVYRATRRKDLYEWSCQVGSDARHPWMLTFVVGCSLAFEIARVLWAF